MSIEIYQSLPTTSSIKIFGDVNSVLQGNVEDSMLQKIDVDKILFGLGFGTFSDSKAIGETFVHNEAFVSYAEEKLITEHGKESFSAPFLIALEKRSNPALLIHYSKKIGPLEELYQSLCKEYLAFALVGCVHFDLLECGYLKKAPIFHEPINENVDKYWENETHADVFGYIFSVVVTPKGKESFSTDILQKAFYQNPKESSSLMYHGHVALLQDEISVSSFKDDPTFYSSLAISRIEGVRHLLGQSIIQEGVFALFDCKEFKD